MCGLRDSEICFGAFQKDALASKGVVPTGKVHEFRMTCMAEHLGPRLCDEGMHVCTCVYMYVCMYVCMHMCVYVCMYVRMYAHVCVCMYLCTYVCTCVYIYVFMYICMYMSSSRSTEFCAAAIHSRIITDPTVKAGLRMRLHSDVEVLRRCCRG